MKRLFICLLLVATGECFEARRVFRKQKKFRNSKIRSSWRQKRMGPDDDNGNARLASPGAKGCSSCLPFTLDMREIDSKDLTDANWSEKSSVLLARDACIS